MIFDTPNPCTRHMYGNTRRHSEDIDFTAMIGIRALNAELAPKWKVITRTKAALPEADEWASVTVKRAELKR
jgi:hypothetical protein